MTVVGATAPEGLWRHAAFRWTLGIAVLGAVTVALFWERLADLLFAAEFALAGSLGEEWLAGVAWAVLPAAGLFAGLLASISPCILPLVPLNVAYIGAAGVEGRRAVALSARFVLGAALALAALGLFGDLAGVLLIEQRGPVLVAAGAALFYLGLASLELLPLPLSGLAPGGNRRLGPIGAGAAFSLVTTPCASPLLAGLLAAASAQSIPGLGALTMVAFALGYTALVFSAGAFGGTAVRALRERSFDAPRAASSALLLVVGVGFAASGAAWYL